MLRVEHKAARRRESAKTGPGTRRRDCRRRRRRSAILVLVLVGPRFVLRRDTDGPLRRPLSSGSSGGSEATAVVTAIRRSGELYALKQIAA